MPDVVKTELYNLREDVGETRDVATEHPEIVSDLEELAEHFRTIFGDCRLERDGSEIRKIGVSADPRPLTEYDENHPYMVAYYDLADMPRMSG
jgi:hypothetical protein